jgi:general secretion pathway protein D
MLAVATACLAWGPVAGAQQSAPPTTSPSAQLDQRQVDVLLARARQAIATGDLATAEALVSQSEGAGLRYPLLHRGDTPSKVRRDLDRARAGKPASDPFLAGTSGNAPTTPRALPKPSTETASPTMRDSGVMTAGAEFPVAGQGVRPAASNALHVAERDTTAVQPAAALTPTNPTPRLAQVPSLSLPKLERLPNPIAPAASPAGESAASLLAEGEAALRSRDLDTAFQKFQAASSRRSELDPTALGRLEGHLRMLSTGATPAEREEAAGAPVDESLIASTDADQQVLARQVSTSVGQAQVESRSIRESEPRRSLEVLESAKANVEKSGLSAEFREQLGRRLDRSIAETKKYIEDNRATIELDEKNAAVLADLDRERNARQKLDEKIAKHVDEFNQLVDEQRFEEAEVVASRLYEVAPNNAVAQQVMANAKFIRREMLNRDLRNRREEGNFHAYTDIDEASIPLVFDGQEMVYNQKTWEETKERDSASKRINRRTPTELEIEQRLKTPVQVRYQDRPLAEVIESLGQMAGVNIHLDPRGLSQEGVSSDTPVSLNLNSEIQLKSALNIILEPLHLGFTVKDEVLKITSETLRDGEVYTQTYYVADLVIPIPNFVPSNNIGLQGLINDALAVTGSGGGAFGAPGPIALANNTPRPGAAPGGAGANPDVLAQQMSGGPQTGMPMAPMSTGPGGLGGAASADFDSLIDLIVSTVATDSWAENGGGTAEIRPFPTNLSLVISQTQAVHEQIADLLEQLRRLQDLQVTIEVRFIRLSDDFFERIGVDFDMNINDNTINTADLGAQPFEPPRAGVTVGAQAPIAGDLASLTADLDIPFRQGSFPVATPQFGGFNPQTAATFGFAILSDIEAYFLINAAQGDSRTNVLNAPKVTLFNGQQAFVSDTSQSPFVISVIPVVGEFAAAQQPVIVVLSEGTLMSIQAVVSEDRRYVRLTVVPFFSEIGDVDTFTFDGSTTTNASSSSSSSDGDDDGRNEEEANEDTINRTVAGTTVQLPTFQFVSVTTTVSVPDGGTVLLGGIKRLSEGRQEFGVPLLSKLPYINRLFRNVGIGRETDSLMMMVTPRIIIQEEEEERLGIAAQP